MDRCPLLTPLDSSSGFQRARAVVHQRAQRVGSAYQRAR
jgi:hypothetical protein